MKTQQPVLTTSVIAVVDLPRYLFASFGGALCAAGAKAFGTVQADTEADNVAPISVLGICLVTAGAAVAAGVEVESDASGRAVTLATGKPNGFTLDAATAAGDVIRILRGI
ncbi:Putative membrane protein [Pseudomonas chlororaphis]|uniref:Membrane protein n=1 Tax=Pseudomonas chlororaphis TaxID=587753 RepID=A0A3G7TJB1_9PSED|nr:capsid cement protein [Pseudomonas chlororaphis]AZE47153.1 Putative membrane protein [Pseudomonas chlororaphis]